MDAWCVKVLLSKASGHENCCQRAVATGGGVGDASAWTAGCHGRHCGLLVRIPSCLNNLGFVALLRLALPPADLNSHVASHQCHILVLCI